MEVDLVASHNERVKGLAAFFLGVSLATIGFAFLRPAIELGGAIEEASAIWFMIGLAFLGIQQYILTSMIKGAST